MRFSVLAIDYDGTIARDGVLDPEVRAAITEVRAQGITVVIVSGRVLSDLRQAAGDLGFVDAVVAENGAVLFFPNGNSRLLGHPPPDAFLAELRRHGIAFSTGQCIVEADASSAQSILAVIRELELPLVLLFNRSRLMVLPQSISKATGLRAALSALRLSVHNAIAIGDAENDHDLMMACELGVAVAWGSRALQAAAEEVLQGGGPSAVAAYIRRAARKRRLPDDRLHRRCITAGTTREGQMVSLPIRGYNHLVTGGPQSGKSWGTGLLCEQLILQGYCVWVVDPEGDYGTLECLPRVVVVAGKSTPPPPAELGQLLRYPDISAVVDLSRVPLPEKREYLHALLPMLASHRRSTGLPHRIVIDEAHYFLQEPNVRQLLDLELGAYTLVTYRPSDLHLELRKAIDVVAATRVTDGQSLDAIAAMCGESSAELKKVFEGLTMDEAVILPGPVTGGKLLPFKLLSRLTPHVRHRVKYFDVSVSEGQGFVFTRKGQPVKPPTRSLREFVSALTSLPPDVLDGHARRGDFSRWIADVFRDQPLSSRVHKVEEQQRLGHIRDLGQALATLIRERYDLPSNINVAV
jgi:hydroxymethylpyrimidine pyrophosphatase-like HAD family hydrolase